MLKRWRKQAGLTQSELAAKLGVSQNTISYWETGKAKPDILKVERLSEALRVSVMSIIEHFRLAVNED